ncbi:hypothetical protein MKW94_016892, partial [Papaver nudicaule]|nr:hypothetical protein [Papaver nudicaule]
MESNVVAKCLCRAFCAPSSPAAKRVKINRCIKRISQACWWSFPGLSNSMKKRKLKAMFIIKLQVGKTDEYGEEGEQRYRRWTRDFHLYL